MIFKFEVWYPDNELKDGGTINVPDSLIPLRNGHPHVVRIISAIQTMLERRGSVKLAKCEPIEVENATSKVRSPVDNRGWIWK